MQLIITTAIKISNVHSSAPTILGHCACCGSPAEVGKSGVDVVVVTSGQVFDGS